MNKYNVELSQRLANKIIQSCKDKFTANKDLCSLLGVDYSDYAARKAVFYGGQQWGRDIKPKTFLIACTKLSHLSARVKPVNEGKDMVISYIYQNHLGRGKERKRVVKVIAQYPPTKFDVEHDENCVVNIYKRIESDFLKDINYFQNQIDVANSKRTMLSTWEEYINSRQLEVNEGKLDTTSLRAIKGYFNNHLLKYCYDCNYAKEEIEKGEFLLCKMPLRNIKKSHVKKMIADMRFKLTREGYQGSELINAIMSAFKGYVVYAEDRDWITSDIIVKNIKKQKTKPKKNIPTKEQVMTFLHKMWLKPDVGMKYKVASALLLTGHRGGSVLSLTWKDVEDAAATNAPTVVKVKGRRVDDESGGNKWKIHLSPQRLSWINQIPRLKNNPYVFWSSHIKTVVVDGKTINKATPIVVSNLSNLFAKLHKEFDSPNPFTPHCIKKMVATATDKVKGRESTKILLPNNNDKVLDLHYTPDPIDKSEFDNQLLLVSMAMDKHFDFNPK